ncbi:MAG: SIS domain-containing protein [Armatimonadetes bacterium]|nr:SIS domain-containing protein [Armatimonadota bacterium]
MSASPYENALRIAEELRRALTHTSPVEGEALVEAILAARGAFCSGQGRSGLMVKAFAMRLVHLGLNAHVVGETTTPAIGPGDLLVVATGSGRTRTTLAIVEAARERGARVACLTAHPASPIAQASDLVVELHGPIAWDAPHGKSVQPPGSLFEQALLICCDAVVMSLMERLGTTEEEMRARHTKLE